MLPQLDVAWTGHRPNKLGGYQPNPLRIKIKQRMLIEAEILMSQHESMRFITGGALGVDTWAAKLAMHLGIPHVVITPGPWYNSRWPQTDKDEFQVICDAADAAMARELSPRIRFDHKVYGGHIVLFPGSDYSPQKMQQRNQVMVDLGGHVLAVWNGSKGGTHNCVKYAQSKKREITIINPKEL